MELDRCLTLELVYIERYQLNNESLSFKPYVCMSVHLSAYLFMANLYTLPFVEKLLIEIQAHLAGCINMSFVKT